MAKSDWENYITDNGDFELPNYLFRVYMELMKESLDMGTMLSSDPAKLRAFKEQIKKRFKSRWIETAKALEFFELVVPCTCNYHDYCEICGGSRFLLNGALSPDELREVAVFYGAEATTEMVEKLQTGLVRAVRELEEIQSSVVPKV